jgi:hypothetical protein
MSWSGSRSIREGLAFSHSMHITSVRRFCIVSVETTYPRDSNLSQQTKPPAQLQTTVYKIDRTSISSRRDELQLLRNITLTVS